MKPLSIRARNLTSFAEVDLDLSTISIASLTGSNGAGKSTLACDAITFALFGVGRSTSADDLVRLGESEMSVELTFELGAHVYRVQRSRRRAKDSNLQFQQQHGTGWKALTGSSIRATQAVIEQTLRLSYESFVSSAFVLQGDAGRFTGATPAARKAVLAEILGLDEWNALNEDFRALASETRGQVSAVTLRVEDLQRRYDDLDHAEAAAEDAKRAHDAAVEALRVAQEAHAAVSTAHAQAEALLAREHECRARLTKAERELLEARRVLAAVEAGLKACRYTLARAEATRAAAHIYRTLATERDELSRKQGELRTLEAKRHQQERTLEAERNRLQTELRLAEQQQRDLQTRAAKLDAVKAEGVTVRKAVEALETLEKEREHVLTRIQGLEKNLASEEAEGRQRRAELARIEKRLAQLPNSQVPCPTCGTTLSPEHREQHERELRSERTVLFQRTIADDEAFLALRSEITLVKGKREGLEQQLRDGQPHRDRLAQLRAEYAQAHEAAQALPAVELRVAELRQALLTPHVGAANALAEIQQVIVDLGYDEARHLACQTQLAFASAAERDLHQLEAAERELPGLEQQEARLRTTERDREEIIATEKQALAEIGDLSFVTSAEEVGWAERDLRQAEHAERLASQALGAAQQTLTMLEALGPELEAATKERDRLAQLATDYTALANACGHKGVPALLIEHAIPEIERAANEILDRFSNGLRVRLVTQREKKSSDGASETLDLIVFDDQGERSISLLSGGERLRVSFAMRLAISRMLASRSGASIDCLICDETTECLDDDGLEKFVECIQVAQQFHSLVVVITHLDQLRDRFGTQIVVRKDPERGSIVEVNG